MANQGLYHNSQGQAANAIAGYFGGNTTPGPDTTPEKMPSAQMDAWKQKARDALANAFGPTPAAPAPAQPVAAAAPTTPGQS